MSRPLIWASLAAALAAATSAHADVLLFVDDDAPAGGDGRSWYTAFNDLQDALALLHTIRVENVRINVAQGVYTPDRGSGDRNASFEIGDGSHHKTASAHAITIQGGFAGLGAPNPDMYDPSTYVTVLSGDLDHNDTDEIPTRLDNSYHVLTLTLPARWAVLRGLTIRSGYADGPGVHAHGAGAYLSPDVASSTALELFDIVVEDCHAIGTGGGIFTNAVRTPFYRVAIRGCSAHSGGALATMAGSSVEIYDGARITDCAADLGGALFIPDGAELLVRDAILAGNHASLGGAIFAGGESQITGSLLVQNHADAGGAIVQTAGELNIDACTPVDNSASHGRAISLDANVAAQSRGCLYWGGGPPAWTFSSSVTAHPSASLTPVSNAASQVSPATCRICSGGHESSTAIRCSPTALVPTATPPRGMTMITASPPARLASTPPDLSARRISMASTIPAHSMRIAVR